MKRKFIKVFITLLVAAFLGLAAGCSGGSDVSSNSGNSTTGGTLTGSGQ